MPPRPSASFLQNHQCLPGALRMSGQGRKRIYCPTQARTAFGLMGVITELTFRLASNEQDPDKPFGARLRTPSANFLVQLILGGRAGFCVHVCMPAYGACIGVLADHSGCTRKTTRCDLYKRICCHFEAFKHSGYADVLARHSRSAHELHI